MSLFSDKTNSAEISLNLREHTFFHGTDQPAEAASVLRQGFRREWLDEEGRWFQDGNLGVGTYLSCDWRMAVWFGNILFRATLQEGTRILDVSPQADRKTLNSMRREFGAQILTSDDPRKVLPANKHLTLHELIELTRYHYHGAYDPKAGEVRIEFDGKRMRHVESMRSCVRMLQQRGFHGFGHPSDDNGILLFQPERIVVEGVIAEIPRPQHDRLLDGAELQHLSLGALCRRFPVVSADLKS